MKRYKKLYQKHGVLRVKVMVCIIERYKSLKVLQCINCKIVSTYRRFHIKTPDFERNPVFFNFLNKNESAKNPVGLFSKNGENPTF